MCYWKIFGTWGNTLGNHWKIVQTHCEHKKSKKSKTPPHPPQQKTMSLSGEYWTISLVEHTF
jgi:hypothetical protein